MGAWIEINVFGIMCDVEASLPLWERGLKLMPERDLKINGEVAPLVGAWIEIGI